MSGVVVTGLGLLSPLGVTAQEHWEGVVAGRRAFRRMTRLGTAELAARPAGQLPKTLIEELEAGEDDPTVPLARLAARQAWDDARLDGVAASRIALVLGTASAGMQRRARYEAEHDRLAAEERRALLARARTWAPTRAVARDLGLAGPQLTVSTSCTSSMLAVVHAVHLLLAGHAEAALVGGVDLVSEAIAAGFAAIGAMSDEPCDPFGASRGMSLGEGAGFLVLERAAHAERRGQPALCAVTGVGAALDGHHPTSPDPNGDGMAQSMRSALAFAGLRPDELDHVDTHGTGTAHNDEAEERALVQVLGEHRAKVGVSAYKRLFGHALGAAGILELVAIVEAMRRDQPVPALLEDTGAGEPPRHALSHGSAFGGSDASVVLSRAPLPPRERRDEVVVLGRARVLSSSGDRVGDEALAALVGYHARGQDHLTRLLLAAARSALADATLQVGRHGVERHRIGLFVGSDHLPAEPSARFWSRIEQRGHARASGRAFARMVPNAPAGAVGRALELFGPLTVITGPGAGTSPVVLAQDMLRQRDDVDALVVTCGFELGRAAIEASTHPQCEAAGALVLARASWAEARGLTASHRLEAAFAPEIATPTPHAEASDMLALLDALDAPATKVEVRGTTTQIQLATLVAPCPAEETNRWTRARS